MAVNTANYNLKKPSQEDFYNIEDHNENMDIIDTQIKKIETELEGHVGDTQSHVPHLGTTANNGNTYTIDSEKTISDGSKFSVKFNAIATGPATLSISSDGLARSLKKPSGEDFKPKAGIYTFIRDGENFQLLGEGGEYGTAIADKVIAPYTIGTEDGIVTGTAREVVIRPSESSTDIGIANNIFFNASIYDGVTQFMPSWTFSTNPSNRVFVSPVFRWRSTVFFSSLSFRATRTAIPGYGIYQESFKVELLDAAKDVAVYTWTHPCFAYGETNKLINGGSYTSNVTISAGNYKVRVTHNGSYTSGTMTSFGLGSSDNTSFKIVADEPLFVNV